MLASANRFVRVALVKPTGVSSRSFICRLRLRQFHTSSFTHATEAPNQPPQTKLAETRLRRFWRLVTVEKRESILHVLHLLT